MAILLSLSLQLKIFRRKKKIENVKEFAEPVPTREVSLVYSKKFLRMKVIEALEKEITASIPAYFERKKQKDLCNRYIMFNSGSKISHNFKKF